MGACENLETRDMDVLRQELAQLRTDFSAITRTLKNMAGEAKTEACAKVRDGADKARVQAGRAADQVSASIEERPFTSMLVTLAAGMLMGVLFGRAR